MMSGPPSDSKEDGKPPEETNGDEGDTPGETTEVEQGDVTEGTEDSSSTGTKSLPMSFLLLLFGMLWFD